MGGGVSDNRQKPSHMEIFNDIVEGSYLHLIAHAKNDE